LAENLVVVANGAGLKTTALITDMDEPLAADAGNALEVRNAVDYLTGKARDPRLHEVTIALGAALLELTGRRNASKELEATLASGAAAERLERMVAALGGPRDFLARAETCLPKAPIIRPVPAEGLVASIATRTLGLAVVELGGGRRRASDKIDHVVGLSKLAGKGAKLDRDRPLCVIHARDEASFARAEQLVREAYRLGDAPAPMPAVRGTIGPTS
jgi:thymidine phosphorylase